MLHDVVEARFVAEHRVFVRFDDGLAGELDLARLIRFDGVFAPLQSVERFAALRVNPDTGTIDWPNGADIAPETLYEALRQRPDPTPTR
ncbi:MAG: DUF2442 domain-containing protein [Acidobacteria bacterium]|nr:DUF2442 domain-containing protein [Acidobacteriota bacterium]